MAHTAARRSVSYALPLTAPLLLLLLSCAGRDRSPLAAAATPEPPASNRPISSNDANALAYPWNSGYPQPYYPQSGYPYPDYSSMSGYPYQQGYPQSGYPQPGYPQNGYPQNGYPPYGYPNSNYPTQTGYQQPSDVCLMCSYSYYYPQYYQQYYKQYMQNTDPCYMCRLSGGYSSRALPQVPAG